ncbi:hypothetical protein JDV02_009459 [Purpureocillium takamizusanense]|uniref:Protein kinase domain-containing protein n=1 Tax=Purpureocillium takamizusanense TaxID=2060973 RepID=A0A9Q8QQP6_9HYPO|nr:uncharacterized protein JDV02_009459 [Purpureocillium takamizusanense]UNI23652.1 hypothetical protein JDV02_009459 [Purpureocillium takamizusanense]
MESIITDRWISHPFTKEGYITLNGVKTADTYGHRLLSPDWSWVESELLDQVMQCQFHRPADRPSVVDLVFTCIERKKRGFPEESDEVTAKFWSDFWLPVREADYGAAPDQGQGGGGGHGGGHDAGGETTWEQQNSGGEARAADDKGKGPAVELPSDFFHAPVTEQDKMPPGVDKKPWTNVKDLIAQLASAADGKGPRALRQGTTSDPGHGLRSDGGCRSTPPSGPGQPKPSWNPPLESPKPLLQRSSSGAWPDNRQLMQMSSSSGGSKERPVAKPLLQTSSQGPASSHDDGSGPAWSHDDDSQPTFKPKGESWPYLGRVRPARVSLSNGGCGGSGSSSNSRGNASSRASLRRRTQRPRPESAPGVLPGTAMRNLSARAAQLQSYLDHKMGEGMNHDMGHNMDQNMEQDTEREMDERMSGVVPTGS